NKVTVGVAGLFGGAGQAFDSPNTENLIWRAFNSSGTQIATGTVQGTQNGLVQFDIVANGIAKISLTPGNDGAPSGGNQSDFLLQFIDAGGSDKQQSVFGYTLEDSNGDRSSSTLTITVNDHATNVAPVVGGVGNVIAYTEQAAAVTIDNALTLTDSDSP